jgi:hypothetical protein
MKESSLLKVLVPLKKNREPRRAVILKPGTAPGDRAAVAGPFAGMRSWTPKSCGCNR